MPQENIAVRAAGLWLAVASGLIILVLLLHGPIAPEMSEQMQRIAGSPARWALAHWIAAAALSLFAVAGLIALTSRSRLTDNLWTTTAWAVLAVGALWTLSTAISEATVIADAAESGDQEVFEAWWQFAEGKANGFAFSALAIAVIAFSEARRPDRLTPRWAALAASGIAVVSFVGWAMGMWLGIGAGSVIWVGASIVMSLWAIWFGIAVTRSAPTER